MTDIRSLWGWSEVLDIRWGGRGGAELMGDFFGIGRDADGSLLAGRRPPQPADFTFSFFHSSYDDTSDSDDAPWSARYCNFKDNSVLILLFVWFQVERTYIQPHCTSYICSWLGFKCTVCSHWILGKISCHASDLFWNRI